MYYAQKPNLKQSFERTSIGSVSFETGMAVRETIEVWEEHFA